MPIKNLNSITVGESNAIDAKEIAWNPDEGTFDMGLLNDVVLQAGQEMHFYGKAQGTISNGDAVMFAGAQGDHLLMASATQAVVNANPEYFVGVATQDFVNNQFGYVTVFGKVRELDTTIYRNGDPSSEGKILWFDSEGTVAGALTTVIPEAPNAKIRIAAVTRDHQNQGSIFVRPMTEPKLTQLQDVETSSVSRDDILTWNDTSERWENGANVDDFATAAQGTLADSSVQLTGDQTIDGNKTFIKNLEIKHSSGLPIGLFIENNNGYASIEADDGKIIFDSTSIYQFNIAGNQLMRLLSNGNLGIGTTTPTEKLEVNGNLLIGENNSARLYLHNTSNYLYGDTNGVSLLDAGDHIRLRILGSEKMRINSTGNIGIGVTSPGEKLHVRGGSGVDTAIRVDTTNADAELKLTTLGQKDWALGVDYSDSGNFKIANSGTIGSGTRLTIDGSGNVGIGTTNPTSSLVVSGDGFRLNNTDDNGIFLNKTGGSNWNYIDFRKDGVRQGYTGFSGGGDYILNTSLSNTDIVLQPSNTEVLRASSNGNVGIGTTSPTAKLDVVGDVKVDNGDVIIRTDGANIFAVSRNGNLDGTFPYLDFINDSSSTRIRSTGNLSFWQRDLSGTLSEKMRLTSIGLGIGTTSPTAKLDVNGNINLSNFSGLQQITAGNGNLIGYNNTTFDLQVGANQLVINPALGSFYLDPFGGGSNAVISGNIFAPQIDFAPNGGSSAVRINSTGLGIGTTSPSTKLHVRESTSLATGMTVQVNPDPLAGAGLINFLDNGGSNIGSIFYNGFSTSYNTSSDYRLKENVVAINEASNKLKRLNPVSFNFINRPEITVDGFIAHEVQDIIPEAVVGEKDEVDNNGNPKYQGIDQSKLVPLLTAALQEAIDRIELLEMSIKQLQK